MKKCSSCLEEKSLSSFPPDRRRKDGCGSKCRECVRVVSKDYYSRYPEKKSERRIRNSEHGKEWYRRNRQSQIDRMRWNRILKKYQLTKDDYNSLLKSQKNKCAICQSSDPGRKDKFFAVDHCHLTGRVRGLLCQKCNSGLGLLGDSEQRLISALKYLKDNNVS